MKTITTTPLNKSMPRRLNARIVSSETFQRFTQFYLRVKDVRSRQKVQGLRSATKFDWIHLKTD